MKRIVQISITIVTIVAVLSISLSFVPESHAGAPSVGLDFDLTAVCDTTISTTAIGLTTVSPGTNSTGSFTMNNTGTATEKVSVDMGDITGETAPFQSGTGGFRDAGDNTLHILPNSVAVDATNNDVGTDTIADGFLDNGGTDLLIANMDPRSSTNENNLDRTVSISVVTDNIQNKPAAGNQAGTLVITLACVDSSAPA